ncbi:hypothetical protein [Rhodococcoides fascians]|uniref:hypothetical protein n=1 Tax=Rhodococcoides fascians TaxID=1828 RepID=UPI001D6F3679|nr:hypothetical protein [Rhodococcus fascians]CAH0300403.1 hypothetical protein SRABI91_04523 [Rhodococcus fascians]
MNVPIPTDDDGYLRRECPACEEQFKWHHGPIEGGPADLPSPNEYYCPLCGVPAATDQWWTKEQIEYAQGRAMPAVLEQLSNEMGLEIKGASEVPTEMTEPNDMIIVQSPCHAYEPVKVPNDYPQPLYCLVCGNAYAV